jgi:hypothetical protein
LRILSGDVFDALGEPLFHDVIPELYLDKHYVLNDREILKALGLRKITMPEFLVRFQADLDRPDSRFKALFTPATWHTYVVNILWAALDKGYSVTPQIRRLEIIPLLQQAQSRTLTWTSASCGRVYYPECEGVRVPIALGLRIIHPDVCSVARTRLWFKLEVESLIPSIGVLKVIARFAEATTTLEESIELLRFLFWHLSDTDAPLDSSIHIRSIQNGVTYLRASNSGHLYFPNDREVYSAHSLLVVSTGPQFWKFIHESYMEQYPLSTIRHGRTWKQFLEQAVMVSQHPHILKRGTLSMSDEFNAIIDTRPDRVVGLMWTYQSQYLPDIEYVRKGLMKAIVPVNDDTRRQLKETVYPTTLIKQIFETLDVENFPFLAVPPEMLLAEASELTIFSRLGVKTTEGLSLYLKALEHIKDSYGIAEGLPSGLVRVYEKLSEWSGGSVAREMLRYV